MGGGGGVKRFWDKDTYTCIGRIIEDQNIFTKYLHF